MIRESSLTINCRTQDRSKWSCSWWHKCLCIRRRLLFREVVIPDIPVFLWFRWQWIQYQSYGNILISATDEADATWDHLFHSARWRSLVEERKGIWPLVSRCFCQFSPEPDPTWQHLWLMSLMKGWTPINYCQVLSSFGSYRNLLHSQTDSKLYILCSLLIWFPNKMTPSLTLLFLSSQIMEPAACILFSGTGVQQGKSNLGSYRRPFPDLQSQVFKARLFWYKSGQDQKVFSKT